MAASIGMQEVSDIAKRIIEIRHRLETTKTTLQPLLTKMAIIQANICFCEQELQRLEEIYVYYSDLYCISWEDSDSTFLSTKSNSI